MTDSKSIAELKETIKNWKSAYYKQADHIEAQDKLIATLEARIDELMIEYCPDEMTPEQIAAWEQHQKVSDLTLPNREDLEWR